MDPALEQLNQALRAQKCPTSVLDRARERIALESGRPLGVWGGVRGLAWTTGLLLTVALAITWLILGEHTGHQGRTPMAEARPVPRTQVVEEAHLSLACIGATVIEAGSRSQAILFNEVKPRLLAGLQRVSPSNQP